MRQVLHTRRVDEQNHQIGDLVNGGLDAGLGEVGKGQEIFDLAGSVAKRDPGHVLQLGHQLNPIRLRPSRQLRWRLGKRSGFLEAWLVRSGDSRSCRQFWRDVRLLRGGVVLLLTGIGRQRGYRLFDSESLMPDQVDLRDLDRGIWVLAEG
jgi:hypothetical protein